MSLGGTARKHGQGGGNGGRENAFLPYLHVELPPYPLVFADSAAGRAAIGTLLARATAPSKHLQGRARKAPGLVIRKIVKLN
ncbi:MAG: hypothetical protein IIC53_11580 [Proteobacteria bacterium]|nr:hypothetical protein [Pseudomonadota bacterium]